MAAEKQNIYLGSDNYAALIIEQNGTALDLSGTTQIDLRLGSHLISSTDATDTATISWNQVGYATGEVRYHLSTMTTLTTGPFDAYTKLYDSGTPNGIVWNKSIPLEIKTNPFTT
jgi:hypothetical protein